MDLTQVKLTKNEWDSMEIPVSSQEKEILQLIINGYNNINIRYNKNMSILNLLRISNDVPNIHEYVYNKYFADKINNIDPTLLDNKQLKSKKLRKIDEMKLNLKDPDSTQLENIFENKLIKYITEIIKQQSKHKSILSSYFTLYKLSTYTVSNVNPFVTNIVNLILQRYRDMVNIVDIIYDAVNILEKNNVLMENEDICLYTHQREIFHILRNNDFKINQNMFQELQELQQDMLDINQNSQDDENITQTHIFSNIEQRIQNCQTQLACKQSNLVLYSAPTGTGKTLTPLAFVNNYRIIFVCAARHVGLALAKNAISMNVKIAFAFGCETADDIRLHYSAASEFIKNTKSGKIQKVDNSVGDKVEIMICDVKSYLIAMIYMKSFNPISNMLLYWDEPTITLDYEDHTLHSDIHRMWKENVIPNIVLSSATLPNQEELRHTIEDFVEKFPNAEVHSINSYDSKKSIPIIDRYGYSVMPHLIKENDDYTCVLKVANHCSQNPTLLRYIDLEQCVLFIKEVENTTFVSNRHKSEKQFTELEQINITNIKKHYIHVLLHISPGTWGAVCTQMMMLKKRKITPNNRVDGKGEKIRKTSSIGPGIKNSKTDTNLVRQESIHPTNVIQKTHNIMPEQPGIYITTKDAETLTDGPTIFLAEDVEKIAKFYLKQSYIPATVLSLVMQKIEKNNKFAERIAEIERKLDEIMDQDDKNNMKDNEKYGFSSRSKKTQSQTKDKIATKDYDENSSVYKLQEELNTLYRMISPAELSEVFIPNKSLHIERWASNQQVTNAFTSNVDEEYVSKIMSINDVSDTWKVLLLMGIGVFTTHTSQTYTEIMKDMASKQRLYLIIASSDYIYGTNYQFCHGYLGKDIRLTQEKMIQALGRIGRNNVQKTYSVRLRDDDQVDILFKPTLEKMETVNMNKLFVSSV